MADLRSKRESKLIGHDEYSKNLQELQSLQEKLMQGIDCEVSFPQSHLHLQAEERSDLLRTHAMIDPHEQRSHIAHLKRRPSTQCPSKHIPCHDAMDQSVLETHSMPTYLAHVQQPREAFQPSDLPPLPPADGGQGFCDDGSRLYAVPPGAPGPSGAFAPTLSPRLWASEGSCGAVARLPSFGGATAQPTSRPNPRLHPHWPQNSNAAPAGLDGAACEQGGCCWLGPGESVDSDDGCRDWGGLVGRGPAAVFCGEGPAGHGGGMRAAHGPAAPRWPGLDSSLAGGYAAGPPPPAAAHGTHQPGWTVWTAPPGAPDPDFLHPPEPHLRPGHPCPPVPDGGDSDRCAAPAGTGAGRAPALPAYVLDDPFHADWPCW